MAKHRRPRLGHAPSRGASARRRQITAIGPVLTVAALGLVGTASGPADSAAPVKIMIVGDSGTQGSAGDFTFRYRLWTHLQLSAPGQTTFVGPRTDLYDPATGSGGSQAYANPNFDQAHDGTWGETLAQLSTSIAATVRSTGAQVLVVEAGSNDLSDGTSPQATVDDMKAFVDAARSANPSIKFVVSHVPTKANLWSGTILNGSQAGQFNQVLDAAVPTWSTPSSPITVAKLDQGWNPFTLTWDGAHPNPTGEVAIAADIADGLSQLGICGRFGQLAGYIPWPESVAAPTATATATGATLTWRTVPGANGYLIEQRDVSAGQQTFTRLPFPVTGTTWTAGGFGADQVIEYRVVPAKGTMTGVASAAVRVTTAAR